MSEATQENLFLANAANEDAERERERWAAVEPRLRLYCAPLAHALGHKNVTYPIGSSGGQLSKELNGTEDKRLSVVAALFIAWRTRHPELNRFIACDVLGLKWAGWQDQPSLQEENERLRTELARMRDTLRGALDGGKKP